jgi:H+/Cl- antiporter ClcA
MLLGLAPLPDAPTSFAASQGEWQYAFQQSRWLLVLALLALFLAVLVTYVAQTSTTVPTLALGLLSGKMLTALV